MRGYQKKVVFLKNIESAIFDEAYFIMKPEHSTFENEKKKKSDLIKEANRIIEESVGSYKKRKNAIGFKEATIFISGFLISSIIFIILFGII